MVPGPVYLEERSNMRIDLSTVSIGLCVIASWAQATPVAPTDYFVRVDTQVWEVLTDTGSVGGPVAQSTNPVTTLYSSTSSSTGINTSGNGVVISTGSASVSANLSTGQLRGAAGATSFVNVIGFPANVHAYMGDTLHFTNALATPATITTVGFSVHIHGAQTNPVGGGAGFAITVGAGGGGVPTNFGFDPEGVRCSATVVTNCTYNPFATGKGWPGGTYATDEFINGTFEFKGTAADIPLYMQLSVAGSYGFTDFGNTVTFLFDQLPEGVSYTSASGQFLVGESTAIPEPSALAVLGGAIAVLITAGSWKRLRASF